MATTAEKNDIIKRMLNREIPEWQYAAVVFLDNALVSLNESNYGGTKQMHIDSALGWLDATLRIMVQEPGWKVRND